MIRRLPLAAMLSALAFFACSTDKVAQSGGDDMGNFVRAKLFDSAGRPMDGRILAFSDIDTLSLELDAGGILVLPSRHRAWLAVRSPSGIAFLLHAPPDSGALPAMRLGVPRPLVGWLRRIATLRIAGVGRTTSAGGLFRFAEVPPGSMLLEAWSDSFTASAPLSMAPLDQDARHVDSFVVAPLVVASAKLVTARRDDTAACGATCQWMWTSANLGADTAWRPAQTASADSFRRLPTSTSTIPDSSRIVAIDSMEDRGNWLLLSIRIRGNGSPLLHFAPSDSMAGGGVHLPLLGAALVADTLVIGDPDSIRIHRVALPRPAGTIFADSLVLRFGSSIEVAPSSRTQPGDTCNATETVQPRRCGGFPGWYYKP